MYFTNSKNQKIFYEYRNNNKAQNCLVFLNGLSQSTVSWGLMLPFLEKHADFLLLDFIFQGESDKNGNHKSFDEHSQDLHELITFLKINQCTLVGISYGSLVAQHFALNYPDKISKIVLMATFAHKPAYFSAIETAWKNVCELGGYPMLLDVMLPHVLGYNYFENPLIPIDVMKEARQNINQDKNALLKLMKATEERVDFREKLKKINCPSLIIHGKLDLLITIQMAEEVCMNLPNCSMTVIENVGHTLNLEAPKICAELIIKFIENETK